MLLELATCYLPHVSVTRRKCWTRGASRHARRGLQRESNNLPLKQQKSFGGATFRLSDVTVRVRDVVRVRERARDPMMGFLKASKTMKR